jgi:hypothetical protein
MIYKFRLLSGIEEDFVCDIELKESQSFLDFHKIIQQTLKYDESFLASFYLCNDQWEKEQEISLMEMNSDTGDELLMSEAVLKDYMYKKYERLIYVYDMFNEDAFFIELVGALKENTDNNYPLCSHLAGTIPPQANLGDISNEA